MNDNKLILFNLPLDRTEFPDFDFEHFRSFLRTRGKNVEAFDLNIEFYNTFKDHRPLYEALNKDKNEQYLSCEAIRKDFKLLFDKIILKYLQEPVILLFNAKLSSLNLLKGLTHSCFELFRENKNFKLILFGPSISIWGELKEIIDEAVYDFILHGYPELAFGRLLDNGFNPFHNTPGVSTGTKNSWVKNLPPMAFKNYADYKIPSFSKEELAKYTADFVSVKTSVGCLKRCAHCKHTGTMPYFYQKRGVDVANWIIDQYEINDLRNFLFTDHLFNGDSQFLNLFCEEIVKAAIRINWNCKVAPDRNTDYFLIKKMAEAGCREVTLSIFSGSDRVLELMNTGFTAEQAERTIKDYYFAGIKTRIELYCGFPGESEEDVRITEKFLKKMAPYIGEIYSIETIKIYPGSGLEKYPDRYRVYLSSAGHLEFWRYGKRNTKEYREKLVSNLAEKCSQFGIKGAARFVNLPTLKEGFIPEVILTTVAPSGIENPPLGLGYVAEHLISNGFKVAVLDFNLFLYHAVHEKMRILWHVDNKNFWKNETTFSFILEEIAPLVTKYAETLVKYKCNLVGFSVCDPKERLTIEVIKEIKKLKPDLNIILGGPAVYTDEFRNFFVKNGGDLIDGYVLGEGEEVLQEILIKKREGENYLQGEISGFLSKFSTKTPKIRRIKDLNSLSFPRYELFQLEKYEGDRVLVEWSRGCVSLCKFCKGRELLGNYRTKTVNTVVEELEFHLDKGKGKFTVCDLVLNGKAEFIEEVCDEIIKRGLKLDWKAEVLPISNLGDDLIYKMKKSGCTELQIGLETASDKVLREMGKINLFDVQSAETVISRIHLSGIKTSLFIIAGYPGEEEEDFQKTMDFISKNFNIIDEIKSINSLHIITGTALHRQAKELGIFLPEKDYHYLWEKGSNIYELRKNRVSKILEIAHKMKIPVLETNINEGKEAKELKNLEEVLKNAGDLRGGQEITSSKKFPEQDEFGAEKEKFNSILSGIRNAFIKESPISLPEWISTKDVLTYLNFKGKSGKYCGPSTLEIDLTNRCNLRCSGCWCHSREADKTLLEKGDFPTEIDFELVLKLIKDAKQLNVSTIQLSGPGEPFLHTKIWEILEAIKNNSFYLKIITNFTLLSRNDVKRLVDLKVDELTISLWAGDSEQYLKLHPGTNLNFYEELCSKVKLLSDYRREKGCHFPAIKIYNVISSVNYKSLYRMVEEALRVEADSVEFQMVENTGEKSNYLALDEAACTDLAAQIENIKAINDYPLYMVDFSGEYGEKLKFNKEVQEFERIRKTQLNRGFEYRLRADVYCPMNGVYTAYKGDSIGVHQFALNFNHMNCTICSIQNQCYMAYNPKTIRFDEENPARIFYLLKLIQDNANREFEEILDLLPDNFKDPMRIVIMIVKRGFKIKLQPELVCPVKRSTTIFGTNAKNQTDLVFDLTEFECPECPHFKSCSLNREEVEYSIGSKHFKTRFSVNVEFLSVSGLKNFSNSMKLICEKKEKDMSRKSEITEIPCYAGFSYGRVRVDGRFIPCCKGYNFPVGNLTEKTMSEVWNSSEYDDFRKECDFTTRKSGKYGGINCEQGCDNFLMNLEIDKKVKYLSEKVKSEELDPFYLLFDENFKK